MPFPPLDELDRLVRQKRGGVVRVVLVDGCAELDLTDGLVEGLAHLAADDLSKFSTARVVKCSHLSQQIRALRDGGCRDQLR